MGNFEYMGIHDGHASGRYIQQDDAAFYRIPSFDLLLTSAKRAADVEEDGDEPGALVAGEAEVSAGHVAAAAAVAGGGDLAPQRRQVRAPGGVRRRPTVARPERLDADHPQRLAALTRQTRQLAYTPWHERERVELRQIRLSRV